MATHLTTWERLSKWLAIPSIILGALFSSWIMIQNTAIRSENQRIQERLDLRDAYLNNGLKETAKKLERGYQSLQEKEARYIEHCKKNPCNLPVDLAITQATVSYIPPEAIYMGYQNKE